MSWAILITGVALGAHLVAILQAWWVYRKVKSSSYAFLLAGLILMGWRRVTALILVLDANQVIPLRALDQALLPCLISLCLCVGFSIKVAWLRSLEERLK